jgi:Na+-driven multidrug efflux pump
MATVYNIGLSLYMFFYFIAAGINRAATGICSNMIGDGDVESIEQTRKIFANISLIFGLIMVVPLIFFPNLSISLLNLLMENVSSLCSEIKTVVYLVAIDVTLATMLTSLWGILLAGGDSKYATITHQVCLWIFVVMPVSILYFINMLDSVSLIFMLLAVWLAVTQFFLYRRYKSMKWYNKLV